jgi:hypothetical protein
VHSRGRSDLAARFTRDSGEAAATRKDHTRELQNTYRRGVLAAAEQGDPVAMGQVNHPKEG